MVLNGKEDNMLIGDPYKFAVLFDRVKKMESVFNR